MSFLRKSCVGTPRAGSMLASALILLTVDMPLGPADGPEMLRHGLHKNGKIASACMPVSMHDCKPTLDYSELEGLCPAVMWPRMQKQ